MKITSKSILSPGHAVRDPPVSLSTSLSRRLRTNRSLKGGQSPMFPTAAKKRGGAAFDNPEPSSPKVTCIGQVRVKTKKQGKKLRTRRAGEVSFRRIEQNANQSTQPPQDCLRQRNQKWVHLPLTICEALRAFGAEFSCLFPCRSSCFSTGERGKEEKPAGGGEQQSSCGAVFARWLVAVEGGKGGREIELVVGGEEERLEMESRERAFRRHGDFVVEGEIGAVKGESFAVKNEVLEEEEEEGRVSICVPPKNALLLMRCRSDPNRISALASRFWESTALQVEQEEDDEQEEEDDDEEGHEDGTVDQAESRLMEDKEVEMAEKLVGSETSEEEQDSPNAEAEEKENPEAEKLEISGELVEEEEEEEDDDGDGEEESQEKEMEEESQENELTQLSGCSSEDFLDPENPEEEERRESHHSSSSSVVSEQSDLADENEAEYEEATLEEEEGDEEEEGKEEKSTEEKETQERPLEEEQEVTVTQERSESEETQKDEERADQPQEREEEEGSHGKDKRESSSEVLPECLLLMRYEPKLSMEVSKETWVCSTDFVRWLPERRQPAVEKTGGDDNEGKKRASTNSYNAAAPQQPPRSSCSLPATAAASMAAMIEQRLVSAVAYEPFVLTRCKSEPMRTAAAKLAPDTCFWKNRKLEPLRRATLGVGAAGVGF
ncbi:uncharacterized protein LOC127791791 [Diospyros lotus]|uniref:uncharacterized protein LOC127791791 n=1 Tax=Diospyros lotus TaxID=55363 RepID=UPI00224E477B|nr:uncharacterized protein LOC127791791 [Diospyros lotus]